MVRKLTLKKLFSQRGSVLIMSIIISSGIMVVGTELALMVVSSMKQGRNSDFALVSQYASEAAIESALHQYRQEELTDLRKNSDTFENNTSWSLENSQNQIRHTNSVQALTKSALLKNQSMVADLYTNGGSAAVENLYTMKISWTLEENCPAAQRDTPPLWPEIEVSVISWTGGSIQWSSDANVKKDFFRPVTGKNEVLVNFKNFNSEDVSGNPLIVQMRSVSCDLRGISMALFDSLDPSNPTAKVVPIPNYHLVKPSASHNVVSRESQAIIPNRQTHSDIFDYTLFSECDIYKDAPPGVDPACK